MKQTLQKDHKNIFLEKAYLNGVFKDFKDCNISIATNSLHYGTSAFGGLRIKVKDGKAIIFRLKDHSKRLSESAKLLHYDLSSDKIEQLIIEFIKLNKPTQDFYLRPLVFVSELSLAPSLNGVSKDLLMYGQVFANYLTDDIKVCFSSYLRQMDASFPLRGKVSGAYITTALAKSEALDRGFDEAILLNSNYKISEASCSNIFIVKNGIVYTPDTNQDILEGITRKSIIAICNHLKIKIVEKTIDKTELILADEAFLTGTASTIVNILDVENYKLSKTHPVSDLIKQKFAEIVNDQCLEFQDWLTKIEL